MTIWKQVLEIEDEQLYELPVGAKVLTVMMQGGKPCIWFLCDESARKEGRMIRIVGTGHPFPGHAKYSYIGSVVDRMFVWHVFEKVQP